MDYTTEGIKAYQLETVVGHLYKIDKRLKKINRNLALLTILGITLTCVKHKDKLKKCLNNTKGE